MSRKGKKSEIQKGDSIYMWDSTLTRERQKARDLRHSGWWRKKVSSGTCHYCGKKFRPADLTMDHIIPLSRGGTSEKINIVPACRECNFKKKHLHPTEWDEYMNILKNTSVS